MNGRMKALQGALGYAEPLTLRDGKARFVFARPGGDRPGTEPGSTDVGVSEGGFPVGAFIAIQRTPEGGIERGVLHEDHCRTTIDGSACVCPILKWLSRELRELGMMLTQ